METIVEERGIPIAATAGNRGIAPSGLDQNPAQSVGRRASGCGRHNPRVTRAWQERAENERVEKPLFCEEVKAKQGLLDAAGARGL
ncbi:hypothetical protein [Hyalangium minutum]|uniref:hypothetical protein n=1 Tax=Hyalangium minutum TaxID=394096 RepID=UPI0012F7BED3|nr:hypothetical protein [Hyalangium minutum]